MILVYVIVCGLDGDILPYQILDVVTVKKNSWKRYPGYVLLSFLIIIYNHLLYKCIHLYIYYLRGGKKRTE